MKIIVFVKQVKYVYAQTGTDPKQNFVGPDDIVYILNPLDELAVEEALRIKEKYQDSEIVVISLGDSLVEDGLRKCLGMGADKAVHIYVEDYERMDAWVTATVLANSIRSHSFDLIFCGRESVDRQDGLVGPYIAQILRIPHISRVIKLDVEEANHNVVVHRAVERGNRERMECKTPGLFTIERGINIPRYPTLPRVLEAQHQMIERLGIECLRLPKDLFGSDSNLTETIGFSTPKPKRKARNLENIKLSAADRLKLIMGGGDSKRKEDLTILEGDSYKSIDMFELLLKENGVVFE
jgi:electron transfer flavoprotein beta subunit